MESMDKDNREAIRAVLTRLEGEGRLTPDDTIDEARNPESPLHGEFTWDLKQAALMTWRAQARALISNFQISIVVHRKEYRIQEFVEAPNKGKDEQGYIAFTRLKNRKGLAQEFLDRELAIASAYVSKTRDYARVLGLERRVEKVVQEISSLRTDAQNKARVRKQIGHAAPH